MAAKNPFADLIRQYRQQPDSSCEGIEGNSRNIRASPPNLKIPYIVKKKHEKIVRKSNTYKLLIMIENCAIILCPSNMWVISIKALAQN